MDIINYSKIKKVEEELAEYKQDYVEQRSQDQLKVATVEKELNDYKRTLQQVNINQEAKQSATGYGIVSLPKNAANGNAKVTIKGNTVTDETGTKSTNSAKRVKSVGKNLIKENDNILFNSIGVGIDNIWENQKLKITSGASSTLGKGFALKVIPNMTYCISAKGKNAQDGNEPRIYVGYSPNTSELLNPYMPTKHVPRTFTPDRNIIFIRFSKSGYTDKNNPVYLWDIQVEKGDTATSYEPYIEDVSYVVAKKDNKLVNLMSHEDIADEIDLEKGILIKRIGVDETGQTYQLAEPEIIPVEVSGNIVSNPSGTIYIENAVADAGVYNNGISIFEQELDINYVDKLSKVDYETGVETELDASKAVINGDKKSFAHPDLANGDMVFFSYFYSNESTEGEATVEYYDSRYVIKDKSTDKFYQWDIEVDNGVPSIKVVEV